MEKKKPSWLLSAQKIYPMSDDRYYKLLDVAKSMDNDMKNIDRMYVMPEAVVLTPFHRFKASPQKPRPVITDESGMIVIVPLREIPHDYAKIEIAEYIQRAGDRKVYVSEIVEELCLDIELVMEIVEELKSGT